MEAPPGDEAMPAGEPDMETAASGGEQPATTAPAETESREEAEPMVGGDEADEIGALDDLSSDLSTTLAAGQVDCVLAGSLRDRICELAERICGLADRNPDEDDLRSRCEDGRERCGRARRDVSARCGD